MIELLAPAKDLEKAYFAYLYGADACYVGGKKYSLRANANNFTNEELLKVTNLAHKLNKKIYVTVNIIFHDKEREGLDDYLKYLDSINVDAIITSDILVINRVKELNLKLDVHVSTQASVLNKEAALYYKNKGATRIVLAREASLLDIKKIKEATNLELESFIHGAMCVSFSGRCVLSNVVTKRDSNRGGCAQICRWIFTKEKSPDFSMTPKDLNMIPFIKNMIEVGVNSFKVEGRMRGIYYIATVISTYRKIIDKILRNSLTKGEEAYYLAILNRCANRESTPQFINKLPGKDEQYFLGREEAANQDFLGLVTSYDEKNKIATIDVRNFFKKGDIVEFFGPNLEEEEYTIEEIIDEEGNIKKIANHPREIIRLKTNINLEKFNMMRLKKIDKKDYL